MRIKNASSEIFLFSYPLEQISVIGIIVAATIIPIDTHSSEWYDLVAVLRGATMVDLPPLTDVQKRVLEFVLERIRAKGFAPSAREICGRLGFKSSRSALDHLEALDRKGYLHRSPNTPRGIAVTPEVRDAEEAGLPCVGRIAAGTPFLAEENIEDHIRLDGWFGPQGKTFLLRVQGDSMTGAGIFDGDLVVVSEAPRVDNGEIAVCMVGEDATVKRFFDEGGRFRLQPENDALKPMYVPKDDPSFRIGGRVVGVIRKI